MAEGGGKVGQFGRIGYVGGQRGFERLDTSYRGLVLAVESARASGSSVRAWRRAKRMPSGGGASG